MTRRKKDPLRKIYGNWRVHHPDGTLIFRCDDKKAQWYLDRDLAEIIDGTDIKLKFIPQGRGHEGDKFYLSERKNLCVCCQTNLNLTRHHIVPYCFRKHFPENIKQYSSHDIVALCKECHNKYEHAATELKMQLAEQFHVDFDTVNPEFKFGRRQELCALGAAKALHNYASEIPEDRQTILLKRIAEYFPGEEITPEVIESLATRSRKRKPNNQKLFGKSVVDKLEDIDAFVLMWRRHFISTMQPTHLPDGWDIQRQARRA